MSTEQTPADSQSSPPATGAGVWTGMSIPLKIISAVSLITVVVGGWSGARILLGLDDPRDAGRNLFDADASRLMAGLRFPTHESPPYFPPLVFTGPDTLTLPDYRVEPLRMQIGKSMPGDLGSTVSLQISDGTGQVMASGWVIECELVSAARRSLARHWVCNSLPLRAHIEGNVVRRDLVGDFCVVSKYFDTPATKRRGTRASIGFVRGTVAVLLRTREVDGNVLEIAKALDALVCRRLAQ